jgi:hypothetical protein
MLKLVSSQPEKYEIEMALFLLFQALSEGSAVRP